MINCRNGNTKDLTLTRVQPEAGRVQISLPADSNKDARCVIHNKRSASSKWSVIGALFDVKGIC